MASVSKWAGARRNGKIDLMRFVFALIIVLHHTRYLLGDEHCLFLGGSLGVEFFFIVSGYLMAESAERRGQQDTAAGAHPSKLGQETLAFLYRKWKSILPEFLTAWTIGFVFAAVAKHLSFRGILRMFVDDFFELTLLKMSGLFVKGFDGVIWYVSAMLLAMAILYPLLRRFPDMFPKIIAPLICLFIMGYLMRTQGHPRNPTVWMGVVYKGLLRAAAEISLGVTLRTAVIRIEGLAFTKPARILLTLLEALGYLGCIAYMYARKPSTDDYFFIALLAAAIAISFANVSCGAHIFDNRLSVFLAKFSTALYFGHIYYAQHLNEILPESMAPAPRVLIYLFFSGLTATFVMLFSDFLRKHASTMRRWFISG